MIIPARNKSSLVAHLCRYNIILRRFILYRTVSGSEQNTKGVKRGCSVRQACAVGSRAFLNLSSAKPTLPCMKGVIMLEKLFKKSPSTRDVSSPALRRLSQMGTHSAVCTMVRTAEGKETRDKVGPVSFYRRDNQLFIRDHALFLVPPALSHVPFSGRGEVVNLQFQHNQTPYHMQCEVVQRVRFSERLLGGLEPREPIGFKICPMGGLSKEEHRGTLRFAHMRGVRGPHV